MKAQLLVVDDELSMREFLEIMLTDEGYDVKTASSGEQAFELFKKHVFDAVLTDVKMPGMSGLELIRRIRSLAPDTPIVAITAYSSVEDAIRAVREGAYDYISKPFQADDLREVIRNALETRTTRLRERDAVSRTEKDHCFEGIIGKSQEMREIFQLVARVAPSSANVLIVGESGVGKELIARAIHKRSPRSRKPFVSINCTAIPETLLESELFGYVKGAFTGAVTHKQGLVEAAHMGALFLDEVGDISPAIQAKLLRFLQDREFRRVGDNEDRKVDVRVIAATNKNLEKEMEEGRFREDLYYRLNVIRIRIPPLREREEDIPPLIDHFIKKYSKKQGKTIKKASSLAMKVLCNYSYPGNVRELENTIERLVTLETSEQLTAAHIPSRFTERAEIPESERGVHIPSGGIDLDRATEELERQLISRALEMSGGGRAKAAALLGITMRSLRYRLAKLGMDSEDT
jgi:two-component system response regulator PilR (NtrC family)